MGTEELMLGRPQVPEAAWKGAGNPYVGPKPLQSCDHLYGRDCELRDLCDLLIAERLVLMYSPSGAGKTSLINAGLIQLLRTDEEFRVLPTLRVNMQTPEQYTGSENRYVRSVKECLLTGLTVEERDAMATIAMPSLSDFLGQRPHCDKDGPVDSKFEVLIFDQFEEICTLDPTDRDRKEQFFSELREALRNRNRWALFVIREDYLAEIDSYSHLLPTALATRFRLNLLTLRQAKEAIAKPAAAAGRPFPPEQVDSLAAELATLKVQRGGELQQAVGEHVEPVQLQVVCRRLWQRQLDGTFALASGAVDEALEAFYDGAVAASADMGGCSERQLRSWIEKHLIVKASMRNQILRTPVQTLGLPDLCVAALVGEHLLRFDRRNGREWVEITHDRMIDPIRTSNERWRSKHLQPFQLQAELWAEGGRGANMLLSQERFDEAKRWLETRSNEASEVERDYLSESKAELDSTAKLALNLKQIARQRRLIFNGAAAIIVALVGVAGYYVVQEKVSYFNKLSGQAQSLPQGQYELTLQYATAAYDIWKTAPRWKVPGTRVTLDPLFWDADGRRLERDIHAALLAGLVSVPPVETRLAIPKEHIASVRHLAFHPGGRLIASGSADSSVLLWNLDSPAAPPRILEAHGAAHALAFNAAGDKLAVGGSSGVVEVWHISAPDSKPTDAKPMHTFNYNAKVTALAFGRNLTLATALASGEVHVQNLSAALNPATVFRQPGQGAVITSIVFLKEGTKLAFGDGNGAIWIWAWQVPGGSATGPGKTERLDFFSDELRNGLAATHQPAVHRLAYDPVHDRLAASGAMRPNREAGDRSRLGRIAIWEQVSTRPVQNPVERSLNGEGDAHAMAFSPDGAVLAYSGGESRSLSISQIRTPEKRDERTWPTTVRFQEGLFSVAFSPAEQDQGRKVAVGGGATISVVDLDRAGPLPTRDLVLHASFGTRSPQAYHADISADGRTVVMGAGSLLSLHDGKGDPLFSYRRNDKVLRSGLNELGALALSADGSMIAVAGSAGEPVRLLHRDSVGKGEQGSTLAPELCPPGRAQGQQAFRLAFHPGRGASQLALASGSALCVVDVGGVRPPRQVSRGDNGVPISALVYSSDGEHLAALEADAIIRVYRKGREPAVFPARAMKITTIAFTSDPRYLAVGTADPDIWILDLHTKDWVRLDPLHDSSIASLHFALKDGAETMLSTDIDGRVMLWEKYEPKEKEDQFSYRRLGRPLTQKGTRVPVALSRDGELLLIGGAVPRMFDLRMPSLLALACETLNNRKQYTTCN